MAMLSDRTGDVVATTDQNADGRIDKKDDRIAAQHAANADVNAAVAADEVDENVGRAQVDEGLAARRRLQERTATATKAAAYPAVDTDEPVVAPVVRGPRPRASLTATVSLILGVLSAAAVLSGLLAGPGVAVGLLAALVGLAGVAATSRRHVAGKSDALLGIALGLAAVVVGVLALTGNLSWLNGDTNMVTSLHDWFAAHMNWLLP